jgi:hypothetical protein
VKDIYVAVLFQFGDERKCLRLNAKPVTERLKLIMKLVTVSILIIAINKIIQLAVESSCLK